MIEKLPGQPIRPGGPVKPQTPGSVRRADTTTTRTDFRQLLDETLRTAGGVKFSAHAVRRLDSRGIALGPADVDAIETAVTRAATKGSRDSLLLAADYALVINVPSKTVVTAFDQQQLRESVITNIDSAVLIQDQ